LLSQTMKVWEKVIDARLRRITGIGKNQFGFVPGRSTTHPVFMVRQMMEKYRRRRKGMHIVFVDMEKAYDRVPRELLWDVLRKKGVAEQYVDVVRDMYRDCKTCVKTESGVSNSFSVRIGVHQGSALSPYLFILVLDEILKGAIKDVPWCMLFVDDMVVIADTAEEVNEMLEKVREALEGKGLKVNRAKTEYMECKWEKGQAVVGDVRIQGKSIKKVGEYKYLGSVVQEDGEINREVEARMQAGWRKWREAKGVLCDKKVPLKLKGKVYATVVRPVMTYGSECWALRKDQEKKLKVTEMRMLRMAMGVTREDRCRNDWVRESFEVADIGDKLAESRLRWFGHVMRMGEDEVVKEVRALGVVGKVRKGRPELTWDEVVRNDMKSRGLRSEMVGDREDWRQAIRIPTLVKSGT